MNNFQAEKELLLLRSESQKTKYKISTQNLLPKSKRNQPGQSRNLLLNLWQEDCKGNVELSKTRWQNKNQSKKDAKIRN